MSLEQREAIALNLERVEQDKATLELRLRSSLEKEGISNISNIIT